MCFGISGMAHPSLAAIASSLKTSIARESLHERFTQQAVNFMLRCVNFVMHQKVEKFTKLHTKLLQSFTRILILDSSCFNVHPMLKSLFPGCRSEANCKLQLCYEYLKGVISFFHLVPEKCTDSKYAAQIPKLIQPGDLFISDLGYFKLAAFRLLRECGGHFLSRFFVGTGLFYKQNRKPINLYDILKKVTIDTFDIPVIMGTSPEEQVACRLIGMRVNKAIANQRRRKMKAKAKARNRASDKKHLFLAGWTLMVTSVPAELLPAETIRPIYGLRWQIELVFKQLKSVLKIHKINTSKQTRLQCQILGKLIVAIIVHTYHSELNSLYWNGSKKHEVSMEKLYKRIQERTLQIHEIIIESTMKAIRFLEKELQRLLKYVLKSKQNSRKTTLEFIDSLAEIKYQGFPNQFF